MDDNENIWIVTDDVGEFYKYRVERKKKIWKNVYIKILCI